MSCGNDYTTGDLVALKVMVTDASTGLPVNATTVLAKVKKPDGTIDDRSADVMNTTIGTYVVNYMPDQVGQYFYEFLGSGAATFAVVSKFTVDRATF